MGIFWRGLLAFSLAMNVAGAAMVAHHFLTIPHDGCPGGCPWESAVGDLHQREGDHRFENLESMRRSFDAFKEGCQCELLQLRQRLVELIIEDEIDDEELEMILARMGSRQVDLQRRLVEQIVAERSALTAGAREVFDQRLNQRLSTGLTGGCPMRGMN